MVGRNDPCPCGSGKKYKKCHGKEEDRRMQEIIQLETAVIRRRFIDEGMEEQNFMDMMDRVEVWFPPLLKIFPHQLIDILSFDTYIYVENEALWKAFVQQELAKPQRLQVRKMLEAWLHPFWLLAKVVSYDSQLLTVVDDLTGKVYTIEESERVEEGDWLFGIAFHDPASRQSRLYESKGLIKIPKEDRGVVAALRQKLQDFDGDTLGVYLSIKQAIQDWERKGG